MKGKGYFNKSEEHSLNARGVQTTFKPVEACKICSHQSKPLIIFKMHDDWGNKSTLSVRQNLDGTLTYSYYQGWGEWGLALALNNLQSLKPFPKRNKHNTVGMLEQEIKDLIRFKNFDEVTTYGL